jgi:hypothetical protein
MPTAKLQSTVDANRRPIPNVMDQYQFCTRTISANLSTTPEYILSAQPEGAFVIQKHFINASGNEDMLFYRGDANDGNPRAFFLANAATLTYKDFWEVF